MMSFLQQHGQRELLKYAAGRQMFCECGACHDAPTTVALFINDAPVKVMCAKCWDRPAWSGMHGKLEVLDGRTLFAPPRGRKQWGLKP